MFVVAGVTGHTGAVVANTLLAQRQPVRVIVRSEEKGAAWKKKGAEVAVADLGDVAAMTRALTGAKGAYLLLPPNFAARDVIGEHTALAGQLAKAIAASGLTSLVFLSSVGAQHTSGTGPVVSVHRGEQALAKSAPSVTFLRAAYFLENWGSVVPVAKDQGVLPHFGPVDVKFPQVCAADIGAAAAAALLQPADGTRIVELAGQHDWSVQDVAAALGTLLGRSVQPVSAPVEGARAGLMQAGLPEPIATLYAEMYAASAAGRLGFERPTAITRGTTPLADALRTLV